MRGIQADDDLKALKKRPKDQPIMKDESYRDVKAKRLRTRACLYRTNLDFLLS